MVDGSLNPAPLCDLDKVLLKELMAENRGLTLQDLKQWNLQHSSVTLTGGEVCEWSAAPLSETYGEDRLSNIASTIPPVDPSVVDLRHNAFLAQMLLEEVDLNSPEESVTSGACPIL